MTVSLHDVRQALTELGKLRFGEMRVQDALQEIVRTTHTIFDVDGAGLMLADAEHHLRNFAVSDERLGHLEELQIRHQEGPCIAAFDDKELIAAEDLTEDPRWPLSARLPWLAGCVPCSRALCRTTKTPWVSSRCCQKSVAPGLRRSSWQCSRSP